MSDVAPSERSLTDGAEDWTMRHFGMANVGTSQLLRNVADAIDQLGDVDVFDITFRENDDQKKMMTVYFARRES